MKIGDRLNGFALRNIDDNIVSHFDFADKYCFLIIVTCNHCPYAMAYWKRLKKLSERYEEDNLGIVAVCGNDAQKYPLDNFDEMKRLHKDLMLPFPYLHDSDQRLLKQLGATKTPEVFLFNAKRELVYRGAIDDNWENEHAVMNVYLEDAVEYCLDGLEVDYPETPAVGCSVKWIPGNEPI